MSQPNPPYGPPHDPNQVPSAPQQAAAQQAAAQQQYMAQQQAAYAQAQAEAQANNAPKKLGPRAIISGVVTIVLIAVGGYFMYKNFVSNQALKAGKCIVLSGSSAKVDEHKEVKCDDAAYSWKIAKMVSNTSECPKDTVAYEVTTTRRYSSNTKVACMVPNLKADTCYTYDKNDVNEFSVSSSCASGSIKITKIEQSGTGTCAEPEGPLQFPTGNVTYCAVPQE